MTAETNSIIPPFPGGSKSKVNRAGEHIRANAITDEDVRALEEWRSAHRGVLNTFQAILRTRTKRTDITVAQRHKRRSTIIDKLSRLPKMQLSRMDDIAGCRLIFSDISKLYTFRNEFHKARFNHRRINTDDKYDYIKRPKNTGYRGIHDVYEYHVNSKVGERLAGLFVEIQYRTLVQHAWATAVEVVGFVTKSQPKFQKGDERYKQTMALASEILARAFENSTGPFPEMTNTDVIANFSKLDTDLGLMRILGGLNTVDKEISNNKNIILIFSKENELEVRTYKDAPVALRELFELEKQLPEKDIVLVKAETGEDIRLAFRNYFSDARDFIRLINDGCKKLTEQEKPAR